MAEVYYFGCVGRDGSGHRLIDQDRISRSRMIRALPWGDGIDGGLAPRKRDARGRVAGEAPQGHALLHVKDGWSVISFWDRSGDHRPASNSAFLARGEHTFDEVVTLAREAFPQIWARFPFEVIDVSNGAPHA